MTTALSSCVSEYDQHTLENYTRNNISVLLCDCIVTCIAYVYILPILCLMGIVTNVLNLLVFSSKSLKGCTFTYLSAMAIMELTSTVTVVPLGLTRCFKPVNKRLIHLKNIYDAYILSLGNTFVTTSVWIAMTVSAERYIFVALSLLSITCCTDTLARRCVVVLFFFSLLLHIPCFLAKQITSDSQLEDSDFGKSLVFKVYEWCRVFLVKIIPTIVISILNGLLIKAMNQAKKRRKLMTGSVTRQTKHEMDQLRITTMIFSVSMVMIVCHLP